MRIFTAGDFHGDEELKEAAKRELDEHDYDMFLAIGDYETPEYYQDLIGDLTTPWLSVTGNWDFGFDPPENGEYQHLYNYQKVDYEDYKIVLLGAVYPDTFQEEIREFFEGTPNARRIVVSHYPPHMLGDLADNGNRAGFPEFREVLMKTKPALWTCGHIHEDFGRFTLLGSTVLNASSQESGKGWRVELGEDGLESAEEVVLRD